MIGNNDKLEVSKTQSILSKINLALKLYLVTALLTYIGIATYVLCSMGFGG